MIAEKTVESDTKQQQYKEEEIIHFPGGLPGFEEAKKFVIFSLPQHEPFCWMECVDGHKIRFVVINPMQFHPDYAPKINRAELESLNVKDPKDLLMYVIVTLKSPLEESTANLMGPVFINIRDRIGKQMIIENDAYSIQEPLLG